MRNASVTELRKSIMRIRRRRSPRGRRYDANLRQQIVAHTLAERSKGISVRSTASSLRLAYPTLLLWLQSRANGFREVEVKKAAPAREAAGLLLVTAQGHRVDAEPRGCGVFVGVFG